MTLHRILFGLMMSLFLAGASAQVTLAQESEPVAQMDRSATGGAQTLEDILARQKGEVLDDSFRRDAIGNPDAQSETSA